MPARDTSTPRPRLRRRGSLLVAAALVLGASGALAGVAAAEDPGSLQGQIDAAKGRLADLQDRTEAVAEKMNAARIAQTAAERKAAAAVARMHQVDADVSSQRAALGDLALRSFESSTDKGLALLGSQDPTTFLSRASDLAQVGRARAQALDVLRAASKRQADARAAADTAASESTAVAETVAAEQRTVAEGLDAQRRTLGELQARQAELVRQAEEAARKAAAEKAAAEAQAAAEKAAADARAEQERLAQQAAALAATPAVAPAPAPAVAVGRVAAAADSGAGASGTSGTTSAAGAGTAVAAAPPVTDAPPAPPARQSGSAASTAIAAAQAEIGKPYVYGAAGPDTFDCSGLTQWAYAKAGIALAHYTGSQWGSGRHVSRDELQPGDLVFFYSDLHHVGLYIGGGQMIDAPHSGAFVRQEALFSEYMGAVRPTG